MFPGVRISPSLKPPAGARLRHAHPLARGLVGAWLLNEGGGTFVRDYSPHSNHGTIGGATLPTWTSTPYGAALSFGGTAGFVNCGSGGSLDTLVRWSAYARVRVGGAGEGFRGRVFDKTGGSGFRQLISGDATDRDFDIMVERSGSTTIARRSTSWVANEWRQIVCTFNGDTNAYTFHLPNLTPAVGTAGSGAVVTDDTGNFYIGNNSGESNTFNGLIAELFHWNRVLSGDEAYALLRNPYELFGAGLERRYFDVPAAAGGGGGTVSKSGTDTATPAATDSKTLSGLLARTDTGSVSLTDVRTILANLARADVAAPAASDVRALTAQLARADAATPAGGDTSALLVQLARIDAAPVAGIDAATLLGILARTDVGTVTAAAAAALLARSDRADVATPAAVDAGTVAILTLKAATDTAALSASEAAALIASLGRFDVAVMAVSEAPSISAVAAAADVSVPRTSEVSALLVALSRTDGGAVTAADVAAVADVLPADVYELVSVRGVDMSIATATSVDVDVAHLEDITIGTASLDAVSIRS